MLAQQSSNTFDDWSPSWPRLALLLMETGNKQADKQEHGGAHAAWSQVLDSARGELQRTDCSIYRQPTWR